MHSIAIVRVMRLSRGHIVQQATTHTVDAGLYERSHREALDNVRFCSLSQTQEEPFLRGHDC